MTRQARLGIGVLLVVVVGLLLSRLLSLDFLGEKPPVSSAVASPTITPTEPLRPDSEQAGRVLPPPLGLSFPSPTLWPRGAETWSADLLRMEQLLPSKEAVREEVRINPHVTPPALVAFAEAVGKLMDSAKSNEEFAIQLLQQLESCVLSESAIESARAFCLSQVQRLAAFYPHQDQIQGQATRIREEAPGEVRRLSEGVQGS